MFISLCYSQKNEITSVGINSSRSSAADLETRTQRIDVVGIGHFCRSRVEQQVGIIAADDAASGVPHVPITRTVGAFDQHEPGAGAEAAVDVQCGASAGVAAHLADAGAGGKEVINDVCARAVEKARTKAEVRGRWVCGAPDVCKCIKCTGVKITVFTPPLARCVNDPVARNTGPIDDQLWRHPQVMGKALVA